MSDWLCGDSCGQDLPLARQWYHVVKAFFPELPSHQRPGVMQKLTDKGNKKGFGKKTVKVMLGNSDPDQLPYGCASETGGIRAGRYEAIYSSYIRV